MVDFNTAVQTALSPAVTLPVIAALVITTIALALRVKARLRAQSKRLGKMTGALLAAVEISHRQDTEREIARAIEFTYDSLKSIGFDKLANGDVSFEGVMFGETKDGPFRRRRFRDRDETFPFSLDELKETLRPKSERKADPFKRRAETSKDPMQDIADAAAGRGPRPYHTAATDNIDSDPRNLGGRSPRAG